MTRFIILFIQYSTAECGRRASGRVEQYFTIYNFRKIESRFAKSIIKAPSVNQIEPNHSLSDASSNSTTTARIPKRPEQDQKSRDENR
jgi:hypothetical protein